MSTFKFMQRAVFCGAVLAIMAFSVRGQTGIVNPKSNPVSVAAAQTPAPVFAWTMSAPTAKTPSLTANPVPEPDAIFMGISGVVALLTFRRLFQR